jgi:hypothetical protein
MAFNPNNSLVKRLLRYSFLLFLFVFGATTIATAETYVCSYNDFSPQKKLYQQVMVRVGDKVFQDQNPVLKKAGITPEHLFNANTELIPMEIFCPSLVAVRKGNTNHALSETI